MLIGKNMEYVPPGSFYDIYDADCQECYDGTFGQKSVAMDCEDRPNDTKSNKDHTDNVDK